MCSFPLTPLVIERKPCVAKGACGGCCGFEYEVTVDFPPLVVRSRHHVITSACLAGRYLSTGYGKNWPRRAQEYHIYTSILYTRLIF